MLLRDNEKIGGYILKNSRNSLIHNNPARTTPQGLVRYSIDFMEAALAVDAAICIRPVALVPALYLVGHSIELSLKAYLLHRGVSLSELRSLGHNLGSCLKKAEELDLLNHVQFESYEVASFEFLDELYSTKQLEYIVTGEKIFPETYLIMRFANKLSDAVYAIVWFNEQMNCNV